jgi:hypothetical protein
MSNVTLIQAREIVSLAISALREPVNQTILQSILDEANKIADPMAATTYKFSHILPKVSEIFGSQVETVLGHPVPSNQIMGYLMQIQMMSGSDPNLAVEIAKITKTLSGDFSALNEQDDELEVLE